MQLRSFEESHILQEENKAHLEKWYPSASPWLLCHSQEPKPGSPTNVGAFHRDCDGKAPTITVIRTRSGCIFGAYASVPWGSHTGWLADSKASLFSLANHESFVAKVQVRPDVQTAVFHAAKFGPSFGELGMMSSFNSPILTCLHSMAYLQK